MASAPELFNLTPTAKTSDNTSLKKDAPLAFKLSPKNFDDYVGQQHLIAPNKPLRKLIESDQAKSILLWGPPGCGKTALSRLIGQATQAHYQTLNAVSAKMADINTCIDAAKAHRKIGKKSIVFIDEIHRFNKVQQDALLPHVENGNIILIGATTENPYFSVIPALLSRTQIFELTPHDTDALNTLCKRACQTLNIDINETAQTQLLHIANGDARKLINSIEMAHACLNPNENRIEISHIESIIQSKGIKHSSDDHYNLISALIKSLRGSDPDASLYWTARLLKGGEDPLFIVRRLIIFASEDIGNADPQALPLTTALLTAAQFIGMPEIQINFGQVVTYLAQAPKSNASYTAIKAANRYIDDGNIHDVPNHLKDSHYKGAKTLGHGNNYHYPHNYPNTIVKQDYGINNVEFYSPTAHGYEARIQERLKTISKIKKKESPEPC